MSDQFDIPVNVFSFHNPTEEVLKQYTLQNYCDMINTYSSFFRKKVGYCSDSNGYWRHRRLEDVLSVGNDTCMQVLTHPIWWDEHIMSPKEKIRKCIQNRAVATEDYYDHLLLEMERENIDK